MATDKGTPSRSSTSRVYINVDDVNDNTPIFDPSSYSEEVPEDVAAGTSVVTLTATDLDSGIKNLDFPPPPPPEVIYKLKIKMF